MARKWLGLSYLYAGDSGRAVPELRLSHLSDPRDAEVTFNLGRAYFRLSMAAFLSVGSTHPDSRWDHLIKGERSAEQAAYLEALAEFQRALLIGPTSSGIHFRRAMVFETEGKAASAVQEYGKELLDRPQHLESMIHLVRLLRKLGLRKEADEALSLGRMSLADHPKTLALLVRLPEENPAPAEKDEGGRKDALAAARVFLTGYAERIQARRAASVKWTEQVETALDSDDPEDALRLIASPPAGIGKDQLQEWKARAQMAHGDFEQALDALLQLAANEPKNPEYSYYLGECAEKLALSTLEEFVRTAPDSYRTYQLQGEYWEERRNFPEAVTAYEKALALKPDASQIHLALGWIYLNEDRRDDAITQLKAELRTDPYSVPALVGMGEVYYKEGQPDRAKTYLLQAISINPNSPQAQMWLGKASADEGLFEEAVEHFQAALKNDVYDRGTVYFQLSRALKQLGRTEEANRYLALYRQSKAEENRKEHFLSDDPEVIHLVPDKD
jgi:tetratricopeptide (TPR) repeat protein